MRKIQEFGRRIGKPTLIALPCIAVLFAGLITHEAAAQDNLSGDQIIHAECTVIHNSKTTVKGVVLYDLATTCGDLTPMNNSIYEELQVNETYTLTTTVGNWANKPTILSAERVTEGS